MNWKLILGLSAVGLGMAFASVYSIPPDIEPICWVAIFLVSTYFIAVNAPGMFFLHAFLVTFIDCIFATVTQVLLSESYLSRHTVQVEMYAKLHSQTGLTAQQMILVSRPALGLVIGAVVGLLATLSSKYFSTGERAAVATAKNDEQFKDAYDGINNYLKHEDTPETNTYAAPTNESMVYSVIVLTNPSEKQLEWVNEGRDNENAIVIPNVLNHPIKGITFKGTHFDLMD